MPKLNPKIRELTGNPQFRKLPKEIKVREGRPLPPKHLDSDKKKIWNFVLDETPPNLITAVDAALLEMYVNAFSIYRQAASALAIAGSLTSETDAGEKVNANLQIMTSQIKLILDLSKHLGLSPMARINLAYAMKGDDLDQAMKKVGVNAILD